MPPQSRNILRWIDVKKGSKEEGYFSGRYFSKDCM
jgi:hypothetical protein